MTKRVPVKFEDYLRSSRIKESIENPTLSSTGKIEAQTTEVLEPAFLVTEKKQSSEVDLLAPIKEWEKLRNSNKSNKPITEKPVNESNIEKTEEAFEPLEMINESRVEGVKGYRIIRDKDETFECKISVEGTTLASARARLVIDSDIWNLTFYGNIQADGTCKVPIKRGLPLLEGATGKIRLEVIADDQLFVGWEDEFVVESTKKVKVERPDSKKVMISFDQG